MIPQLCHLLAVHPPLRLYDPLAVNGFIITWRTPTTPFPGSPLYQHIMKNGLLQGDEEFFERYFSGPSDWNMVVNLSRMSDEEVWAMHSKLTSLYYQEQKQAIGRSVRVVSKVRRFWRGFNRLAEDKLVFRLPKRGKLGTVSKAYRLTRDVITHRLEDIELKLRGL
jgi:hypothetical protein